MTWGQGIGKGNSPQMTHVQRGCDPLGWRVMEWRCLRRATAGLWQSARPPSPGKPTSAASAQALGAQFPSLSGPSSPRGLLKDTHPQTPGLAPNPSITPALAALRSGFRPVQVCGYVGTCVHTHVCMCPEACLLTDQGFLKGGPQFVFSPSCLSAFLRFSSLLPVSLESFPPSCLSGGQVAPLNVLMEQQIQSSSEWMGSGPGLPCQPRSRKPPAPATFLPASSPPVSERARPKGGGQGPGQSQRQGHVHFQTPLLSPREPPLCHRLGLPASRTLLPPHTLSLCVSLPCFLHRPLPFLFLWLPPGGKQARPQLGRRWR